MVVIPAPSVVIPDSATVIPGSATVIPGSTRDPVPGSTEACIQAGKFVYIYQEETP
jgi:hypothetical protein